MKKIVLIRHGKSSWDQPVIDHERKLTTKGIENTIKIANESIDFIDAKSTIWSSSAQRAFQTACLIVNHWKLPLSSIIVKKELYTFDSRQLEQIVKSCPNDCESLILFGHNNAITDFVNKFGDIFIDNVPTSGLVSIIFETTSWTSITKGKTNKILVPRDI
jgi:phosphohistidine phosphatase